MITIDRAIEVVGEDGLESGEGTWEEYLAAIQLGREGLKAWQVFREVASPRPVLIMEDNSDLVSCLPGEAKE